MDILFYGESAYQVIHRQAHSVWDDLQGMITGLLIGAHQLKLSVEIRYLTTALA